MSFLSRQVRCRLALILTLCMVAVQFFGCRLAYIEVPKEPSLDVPLETSVYDKISKALGAGKSMEEIISLYTIGIADDIVEWPPYTFNIRANGLRSDKLTGYSIDVIREIFSKYNIKHRIDLMPWKRVLMEVGEGKNYFMLPSASYSSDRASKYYISEPYYKTTPHYFYSKRQHPTGLKISSKDDLKNYRVVGLKGHNYTDYCISDTEISTTADTYEAAIKQLHAGYYDVLPESIEILAGYSILNEKILEDELLGYEVVPDMEPVYFYMMFSRNEVGLYLKNMFDRELEVMKESGRLEELLSRYISNE